MSSILPPGKCRFKSQLFDRHPGVQAPFFFSFFCKLFKRKLSHNNGAMGSGFKKSFLQGLTRSALVRLLCNTLLARIQGQIFTTSGSITLMSGEGLLL